ncbi:MAG TPA: helix-turn-helix transcriptional regulator [Chthoniobacterales bacterium]|jgi:XRE family aerobic/anaerobic benzoate catabolism transcriptional regulator
MASTHEPASFLSPVSPPTDSLLLRDLAQRIRTLRKSRSLTRKTLSQLADVSERHLAQLESGEGNISVLLLNRIAKALNTSLAELFTSQTTSSSDTTSRSNRIALIGLRGAGKSTLGEKLAAVRNIPFIELDREIEKETGMPLADIFSLYGQSGYRAIERRTLERVTNEYDRAVFSIGGGVVTEPETYDFLRANCYTVWIKAKPQEHMDRVMAQGDFRAMAGNDRAMDDLRQILTSREPLYRKADMTLDTAGATVDESFDRLQSSLTANSSIPELGPAAKSAGGPRG